MDGRRVDVCTRRKYGVVATQQYRTALRNMKGGAALFAKKLAGVITESTRPAFRAPQPFMPLGDLGHA